MNILSFLSCGGSGDEARATVNFYNGDNLIAFMYVKNKDTGAYDDVAKNRNNYFTVMPTVKASWFDRKNISLYSKVAAGVCIAFKDSKVKSGVSDEDAKTLLTQL